MNQPNSQYDNGFFDRDNENGTCNYTFSDGGDAPEDPKRNHKNPHGGKPHGGWGILAFLLCIAISFGAGFGGVMAAEKYVGTKDNGTDQAGNSSLYTANAAALLPKSEAAHSVKGSAGEEVFSVSQVAAMVENTVVVIDVSTKTTGRFGTTEQVTGSGSGVIISENGYILTCNHVVEGASSVKVTLKSGDAYDAVLVGCDEAGDIAVLKIDAGTSLPYAEQGCSADLVVGEWVVAVGNPLGTLGGTVTTGIISATERNVTMSDGSEMTLIQTDTAINSGNSGGGLFNLKGQLIGIVNAKYSASGVEGLAFAIPIDTAYVAELDLIQYGYVRNIIDDGLTLLEVTEEDLKNFNSYYTLRYYGISEPGLYVVESTLCTELQNKDRLISVDGTEVSTQAELDAIIKEHKIGDTLTIVALRDGKKITASLTLQEYVPDRLKK